MDFVIHRYDILSSTQDALRQMAHARHGFVACAKWQTCGRGQRANVWESEHGCNLLMSVLLQPSALEAGNAFELSRMAALAAARCVIGSGIDAKIKWTNDILCGNQKIAGILIEPTIRGGMVLQAIVGIGINVNQLTFGIERASSMALLLGCRQDLDALLQDLLSSIDYYYAFIENGQYQILRDAYSHLLYRKTGMHKYRAAGQIFVASIVEVSADGMLCLQKDDGSIKKFHFKEVEFVW
jgi:BirA family biotin operon repressor/biotin-[acetyl-CoA-carboxylase] ligase